ncbi:DUF2259 domain-containing protein [Roseibium polysiphoniae]|uniref:DUF2259 domain-containing protein n=1 Tax=Roseibium polysiphoniae TaxID=2571221 RepID=A0A944CG72_9HYPH|nr:DUF2259 domain-containing protein [Roseibium polysiphoniae]MBS8262736.1 DUF2259 domain-containing protein [Roseibium polysiphoniae]
MAFLTHLRGLACQAVLLLAATPAAVAGDYADVEILGFSDEGFRFAFEQYGVQAGSGVPYSDIFVIDVPTDSWFKPSPFRLKEEIDDAYEVPDEKLDATREKNLSRAVETLANSRISGRGRTVGHNPVTEIGSDPHQLTVNPRLIVPPANNPMQFSLEEYPLPSGDCASYGADTRGFKLTLSFEGTERVLNEDTSLPSSRGCPLRYRIERAITYYPAARPPVFAVLVLMETHGFEGPDGRYLAITGQF